MLKVSLSGYYDWRDRASSLRAQSRAQLDGRVRKAFEAKKARIGSPRVARRLKAQGHTASHNQVAQTMARQALLRDHGLICSMSAEGNCYDNAAI